MERKATRSCKLGHPSVPRPAHKYRHAPVNQDWAEPTTPTSATNSLINQGRRLKHMSGDCRVTFQIAICGQVGSASSPPTNFDLRARGCDSGAPNPGLKALAREGLRTKPRCTKHAPKQSQDNATRLTRTRGVEPRVRWHSGRGMATESEQLPKEQDGCVAILARGNLSAEVFGRMAASPTLGDKNMGSRSMDVLGKVVKRYPNGGERKLVNLGRPAQSTIRHPMNFSAARCWNPFRKSRGKRQEAPM